MRFAKQTNIFFLVVAFLLRTTCLSAQHDMHSMGMPLTNDKPIVLIKNIGGLHHLVSTNNAEAQKYFDQGLALIYALNKEDAMRSFKRASELDTNLAMAYWGMAAASVALSSAVEISNEERKNTYDYLQKASSLQASAKEQTFIEALLKKVPADSSTDPLALNAAYRDAMKNVFEQYPTDADAGVFYAWSVVSLKAIPERPWVERWDIDGNFTPEGAEGAKIFEGLIKKFPDHFGAYHFYIHAVEGSTHPEMALESAKRIAAMKFDDLRMGHLLHMPAHIYLRMGYYEEAAKTDEAVLNMKDTMVSHKVQKFVHGHSVSFLAYTYNMQGRYRDALNATGQNFDFILPNPNKEQLAFKYFINPQILVNAAKWEDILQYPKDEPGEWLEYLETLWANGMANVATGKLAEANNALKDYLISKNLNLKRVINDSWQTNSINNRSDIMENMLLAKIALAKKDYKKSITCLTLAVAAEDSLNYQEPPYWMTPARESLGGVLLLNKNYSEAEKVFLEELKKRPNNPRALFGLFETLKAEGKKNESVIIEKAFKEQWKYADTQLSIEDL